MKTIIISIIFILLSKIGISQKFDVPQKSQDYFQKEFNTQGESQNIVWVKNQIGYVVYYDYNDKKRSVLFDDQGNYKENRIFIDKTRLNTNAQTYLNTKYKDANIVQCYEVVSNIAPERNEVEIEVDGSIITLFFRPNGEFHFKK